MMGELLPTQESKYLESKGAKTASVFPLPVPDITKVSSPFKIKGIEFFWVCVRSGKREKKAVATLLLSDSILTLLSPVPRTGHLANRPCSVRLSELRSCLSHGKLTLLVCPNHLHEPSE